MSKKDTEFFSPSHPFRRSTTYLSFFLQTLGQSGVTSRFQHAFELSQHLQQQLASLSRIRLLVSKTTCYIW